MWRQHLAQRDPLQQVDHLNPLPAPQDLQGMSVFQRNAGEEIDLCPSDLTDLGVGRLVQLGAFAGLDQGEDLDAPAARFLDQPLVRQYAHCDENPVVRLARGTAASAYRHRQESKKYPRSPHVSYELSALGFGP
jgi:hypothetical protein